MIFWVLVGIVTGMLIAFGIVYFKQRHEGANRESIHGGVIRIADVGDKRVFTLELEDDPVVFEDNKEVVFQVKVEQLDDG